MTNQSLKFIKESSDRIQTSFKTNQVKYLYNNIIVFIKDPLPEKINLQNVLNRIEKTVPIFLTQEVDEIFIGQFSDFSKRDINAIYRDGAIFVTNNQSSEIDLFDDIVHELAHAVEKQLESIIYHDQQLEREFLAKRKALYYTVQNMFEGSSDIPPKDDFLNTQYSLEFDKFLYKKIGYQRLRSLIAGIFLTPYSVTCLREYFAVGFEEYYVKNNITALKNYCPSLYKKLDTIESFCHNNGKEV